MTPLEQLPWPLVTLDFEASSLGKSSYPIEVGICRWLSPDRPLESWSTLIQPTEEWRTGGEWSIASSLVHMITQDELETGMEPTEVVGALNRFIGSHTAWCDGGEFDLHWALRLVSASKVRPEFKLEEWGYARRHSHPRGLWPHAALV